MDDNTWSKVVKSVAPGIIIMKLKIETCVINRLRVRQDRFLLINSRFLRCWCSVTCFNLDKIQEVRPLGVGSFTIRSHTRNYIVYWGTTYFGMSGISMSR